jgi:hypothetical protein
MMNCPDGKNLMGGVARLCVEAKSEVPAVNFATLTAQSTLTEFQTLLRLKMLKLEILGLKKSDKGGFRPIPELPSASTDDNSNTKYRNINFITNNINIKRL